MLASSTDDLDRLLREEKCRVALEFFQDAWDAALEEGIEPAILADMALTTALTGLGSAHGQEVVEQVVRELSDKQASGHFIADRTLQ